MGTYSGVGGNPAGGDDATRRLFAIEFAGGPLEGMQDYSALEARVNTTGGKLQGTVITRNPHTGGVRISIDFEPEGAQMLDLRCSLWLQQQPVSEVWIYRWTV